MISPSPADSAPIAIDVLLLLFIASSWSSMCPWFSTERGIVFIIGIEKKCSIVGYGLRVMDL
jgi:hypothetical protein